MGCDLGLFYGCVVRGVCVLKLFRVVLLGGLVRWVMFGIVYGGFVRRLVI